MVLFAFGSNLASQLGKTVNEQDDTYIPIQVDYFKDSEIQKIACGVVHNVILKNNKVYTFGCNDEGALGRIGDEQTPALVNVKANSIIEVSAGICHSACLSSTGTVYAWGTFRNISGIIGFKNGVKIQKTPIAIARGIRSIKSTDNTIIMLTKTGFVKTYGIILGKKPKTYRKTAKGFPVKFDEVYRPNRKQERAVGIGAGNEHGFGITEKGKAFGFGCNNEGQLGNGKKSQLEMLSWVDLDKEIVEIDAGSEHSLFLEKNGTLYTAGENINCQLGITDMVVLSPKKVLENVQSFSTRGIINIAMQGNELYSWGVSFHGELGFDQEEIKLPTKIPFNFGNIKNFKCGNNHVLVHTKEI